MRRNPGLDLPAAIRFVPGAAVLLVWAALLPAAGGFNARDWLPAGLALAGIAVVAAVGRGRVVPARPTRLVLYALAAYTAWSFVSLLWSSAPGEGLQASDQLLLAVLTGWTIALLPWNATAAETAVFAFATIVALVCLFSLVGAAGAGTLAGRFTDGRYNQPLDYPNASAALCVLTGLPALVLASRPGLAVGLKAAAQAVGTFLLASTLLQQSRGAVLGAIAAVLVLVLVVPYRWRLLASLLVAAVGIAVSAGPALAVYDAATTSGDVAGPLADAAWSLLAAGLVGAMGGAAIGLAERKIKPGEERRERIRRVGWGLVAACVLLVVAGAAVNAGRIASTVDDQWQAIQHPGGRYGGTAANPTGRQRLTTVDPIERYDYWRVSVAAARAHPLGGDGAGSFEHRYTAERRYPKPSKYPHNLVMRVLGDTGLVGLLLWGTFAVALVAGLVRGLRGAGRRERALSGIALSALAYMAVHASLDWLETYPVIAGCVLAYGLIALATRSPEADEAALARLAGPAPEPRAAGGRRLVAPALAGAAVLVAVVALALPWFSLKLEEEGTRTWRTDPDGALRALARASSVNPLSATAAQDEGLIALQLGRPERARAAFEEALDRETTWVPLLQLALLDAQAGDRAGARAMLARARQVNPREPILDVAEELLADGRRIDPAKATRQLFDAGSGPERRSSN